MFEEFNSKLGLYWKPDADLTADEMLSLFRGRCGFKIYNKMKPGKYGILFRMLTDANFRYVLKMEPYVGKDENRSVEEKRVINIVKRLVHQYRGSESNVTTDRYYTSRVWILTFCSESIFTL